MFPLKDFLKAEKFPFVNWAIILANIAVFAYIQIYTPVPTYLIDFGLVPAKLGLPSEIVPFYEKVYPFFTSLFIHAGWLHLLANIYFLYIFGDNVEDKLGHVGYFISFISFGLVASILQVVVYPISGLAIVGASGAVAGVMGSYIVYFPGAKLKTLVILIIFITVVNIPAAVFIGLWFLLQVVSGFFMSGNVSIDGGVAWWAHIGGFMAGALMAIFMKIKNRYKF